MNSKRSYLETLNAGRQRRPEASLEQLHRSLETLEERLRQAARTDERDSWASRPPAAEPRPRAPERDELQTMVREVERARDHEDGVAAAGRIASEIRTLREEFASQDRNRGRQAEEIQSEVGALRRAVERAPQPDGEKLDRKLAAEFDRLSAAISGIAEKGGERGLAALRPELEQVRAALGNVAREDSLRTVAARWEALENRLDGFDARLADAGADKRDEAKRGEARLAELDRRLDGLGTSIAALPTSHVIEGFDEKLRLISQAVDGLAAGRRDSIRPEALKAVEERMDELARAVAAAAAREPAPLDTKPFERIEARLSAVSQQMQAWEANASAPADAVMERLSQLSERVDELAARANLPAKAVDQLAHQVSIIADKLDRMGGVPDPDFVFKAIEQRFDTLAAMLERRQGDAGARADLLFRDLERRLDEVVERLDTQSGRDAAEQSRTIAAALDARFEDFAKRFAADAPSAADGKVIRSLEEQIKALVEHLGRPAPEALALDVLVPRMEGLERSIADGLAAQNERVAAAAREAAEEAVRALGHSSGPERDAVAGFAQDLKTLETLNRRSDERNAKTFEAIHDTLIKIVDRLAALEPDADAPPARAEIADAPSLDPEGTAPLDEPVSLAQDASAPEPAKEAPPRAPRGRSMLGGISRALGRGGAKRAPEAPPAAPVPALSVDAPSFDLDAPLDPKIINQPLEPGSGTPDLSAIMRRVRDERAQAAGTADAAKSDFIAAARRAAQAAAAEAEVVKKSAAGATPAGRSRIGALLRRKTVLMAVAAVMIALAGLQATKSFVGAAGPGATAGLVEPKPRKSAAAPAPQGPPTHGVAAAEPAPKPVRTFSAPPSAPPAAQTAAQPAAAAAGPAAPPAPPTAAAASAALAVPPAIGPAALREAAGAGDPKALWEVASRFSSGRDAPSDPAEAARWFEAAAKLGLVPAQYRLGSLYEKGTGVERDVAKAKLWYAKAAEGGNASAMHNLAVLYAMGADGAADNQAAVRWFTEAAEHGVKDSQFNLGILAAKGAGMGQDLESSYKWFALVAKAGDKDAAAKRDEVAKALKPEQLKRAEATTELWKAKALDPEANGVEIPDSWREDAPASTAGVDMKAAVRTIQLILEKNGYQPGGTDGVMGARTKSAIIAFQKDNDLPANGEVDDKLVKALLARK
jgi:localization factor PodJL